MAVLNSDFYKPATVARTAAETKLNPANGQELRVAYAKITASSLTIAQNDFINLFDLPEGAIPMFIKYTDGVRGALATLDIGTIDLTAAATVDEDRFEAAVDVSAGATQNWLVVDDSTPLTAPATVRAKYEGANPADNVALEVWLAYFGNT